MESLGSHLVQTSYLCYPVKVICFLLVSEDDWNQTIRTARKFQKK